MSNVKHVAFCTLALAAWTSLLASCGEVAARAPDAMVGPDITSVEISPTAPSVALGLTTDFTLTAHHSDGETSDVTDEATWTSSATAVATISATGEADTLTLGTTTITGTLDGLSDDTTLTVTAAELTGLRITPDAPTIVAGQTQTLMATAIYSDGDVDVTATAVWSTSEPLIATPSVTAGQIDTLRDGAVTVTATFSGETDTTSLTISQAPLGTHRSNPGNDCTELLGAGVATDGQYWIDPDDDGNPSDAFRAYCDMTTDGGGWTLLSWTGNSGVAPFGVPFPGHVPCPTLDCVRGSAVGPTQAVELMRRSTEFGKGQTDPGTTYASYVRLGDYTYSGKYTYGSLAGLNPVYGAVTCSATGQLLGRFRSITGPNLDHTSVYLNQNLAYSSLADYTTETSSYIWTVGYPGAACGSGGSMPGTYMGTWTAGQYGPQFASSAGAHAVFVRGATTPRMGETSANAGTSCRAILDAGQATGDHRYWISPNGTPIEVQCDMTTAGGGWAITYDVAATHFDAFYLNNATTFASPPLARNQYSDVWNAEAIMTVTETLVACGQQDNTNSYYWTYNGTNPHQAWAGTADAGYLNTFPSVTTSGPTANCVSSSKGFAVLETGNSCGTCNNMLWGMYHYSGSPGCNSGSNTYGNHATPWAGARQITYPLCNLQQTSNGRFWIGVR